MRRNNSRNKQCFIPGCKSSYDSPNSVRMFKPPSNIEEREQWEKIISSKLFIKRLKQRDILCEKHFDSNDVISDLTVNDITIPYKRPRLRKGAMPKLNCLSFFNESLVLKSCDMIGCVALGCTNRPEKGYLMKTFPTEPCQREEWLSRMNRPNWVPTNKSVLCEMHFEECMWEKTSVDGTRKLKCTAVPTIFNIIKLEEKQDIETDLLIPFPSTEIKSENEIKIENTQQEPACMPVFVDINSIPSIDTSPTYENNNTNIDALNVELVTEKPSSLKIKQEWKFMKRKISTLVRKNRKLSLQNKILKTKLLKYVRHTRRLNTKL